MVLPSCPPEGTGSGASILLDAIKGLLWEAPGCLGSARNMKDTLCVQASVPRESPPSVRLGRSSSAPSLSRPLRRGALSAYRRRGAGGPWRCVPPSPLPQPQEGSVEPGGRTGVPLRSGYAGRSRGNLPVSKVTHPGPFSRGGGWGACCETFWNVCVPSEVRN